MHNLTKALTELQSRQEQQEQQVCRVCGCTQFAACPGGCFWVEDDLCSACVGILQNCE